MIQEKKKKKLENQFRRRVRNFRTCLRNFAPVRNLAPGANFRIEQQPYFVSPINFSSELRFG